MRKKKFEYVGHTSEIKIKTYASTLNGIFRNTVVALSDFMSRKQKIKPKIIKRITIQAEDTESLLYEFIDEIVYLIDAKNFIVSKGRIKVNEKTNFLEAEILGDKASNYSNLDHIKAATYSDMYVKKKRNNSWEAVFVIDV